MSQGCRTQGVDRAEHKLDGKRVDTIASITYGCRIRSQRERLRGSDWFPDPRDLPVTIQCEDATACQGREMGRGSVVANEETTMGQRSDGFAALAGCSRSEEHTSEL